MCSKSSFNGRICEIPEIFVDNFENPTENGARAYFLSHFHTDHTVGLTDSRFISAIIEAKNVFIYTTKMTAAIIEFNSAILKEYVKELKYGYNLITIQKDSNQPEKYIGVTLIPAGHCLGSTMFLFETSSINVLYTGDFRIRSNDLPAYAAFHDSTGKVIKLDALYVDTTFIDEPYTNFPKRSDSVEEAVDLIKGLLENDGHVILETSANYGYEHVFNRIHKVLGMKVYVDDNRWRFYSKIRHLVPGVTNNVDETRVYVYTRNLGAFKLKHSIVRFSAQVWRGWQEEHCSVDKKSIKHFVCFATHCSRSELVRFVEYLSPTKVVGFPNPYRIKVSPTKGGEKFERSPRKSPKKRPCSSGDGCPKDRKVDPGLMKKLFGGL